MLQIDKMDQTIISLETKMEELDKVSKIFFYIIFLNFSTKVNNIFLLKKVYYFLK